MRSWAMRCKTEISRAALPSLNLSGFQRPDRDLPCSHQTRPTPDSAGKASHLASFFISRTTYTPPGPQPNEFYHAACFGKYSNKPITSFYRNQQAPHPLVIVKPDSHSPFWFILFPSAIPMWPCMAYNVQAVGVCD